MSGISKIASERIQRNLLELAAQPGNGMSHHSPETAEPVINSSTFKTSVQIVSREILDGLLTIWAFSYGVYFMKFCRVHADVHQMQRQLREHPSQAWYSHHESVRQRHA